MTRTGCLVKETETHVLVLLLFFLLLLLLLGRSSIASSCGDRGGTGSGSSANSGSNVGDESLQIASVEGLGEQSCKAIINCVEN